MDDEPHIEGVTPWDANGREWACWCHLCRDMRLAWPETTRMWNPNRDLSYETEKDNGNT